MNIGLYGPPLSGRTSTLRAIAAYRRVEWDWLKLPLRIGDFEFRTAGSHIIGVDEQVRAELLAWSEAVVVVLDPQPETWESNLFWIHQAQAAIASKPRIYQINKIDLPSAMDIAPRLHEFGWHPRLEIVRTSMRHVDDRDAKPIGVEALWKAIERLDPASS